MQLPCARQWTFAVARQSSFMVAQADGGVCLRSRPAVCIVVAHLVCDQNESWAAATALWSIMFHGNHRG